MNTTSSAESISARRVSIITEVEIPLAPAYPWAEVIVTFDEFMTAAKFGQALGNADGMIKKLISVFASQIP